MTLCNQIEQKYALTIRIENTIYNTENDVRVASGHSLKLAP